MTCLLNYYQPRTNVAYLQKFSKQCLPMSAIPFLFMYVRENK